ncbi:hypothetical protein HQN90_17635 [Paenibacillus alba]|uniref:hypothetical protein n=1 Tax=Paenibacillus alba TaxID=1197127 RepID=UPI0015649A9D|nr:hypothetical protein [Paenibacillus alba]NQX67946.1 hypothetical protein [Paenibacillus alba]
MSDKKIDLILSILEQMDKKIDLIEKRFDRNEEMIGTLIQMVGSTNAKVEELAEEANDNRGSTRYFNHRLADLELEVEKLKNK